MQPLDLPDTKLCKLRPTERSQKGSHCECQQACAKVNSLFCHSVVAELHFERTTNQTRDMELELTQTPPHNCQII